ncbi:DUF2793 domain-containing protein [Sphingomonas oligophenolica]|uniref:DUF2793 domain-containing protein n=1 Tax=Sphingomonas oligophenolica TaxID=301154 RepID=A0A502CRT6_9SPHN|nr:DUF2793 domain-containing protein [Sphingomonas oligophenolica]TPG15384.1 DUF2793 domain-containing protein [Sphingomonas oligophenolica]
MENTSARLDLPLIVPGQAGKDLVHNEALTQLAFLIQPAVLAVGATVPPSAPAPGEAWILGDDPTGEWAGQAHSIAGWTAGGWRFVAPTEGMAAWSIPNRLTVRFDQGSWTIGVIAAARLTIAGTQSIGPAQPITEPDGGTVIDLESRTSISAILGVLRFHGLIAPS